MPHQARRDLPRSGRCKEAPIVISIVRLKLDVSGAVSIARVRLQREYVGYYPLNAQDFASERRKRQRKLCRNDLLRRYVMDGLERCWSPEQIAGRLKHEAGDDGTVCHETIYRYVYGPEGREAGLCRYLPKARRRRQQRYGRKPR